MKLRQNHVTKFRNDVQVLHDSIPNLLKSCDNWLKDQKDREESGSIDNYFAQINRGILERELDAFRTKIADIYDHMAERGLRDVQATQS